MRPLDKGDAPLDLDGNPVSQTDYKKWRRLLIERIGYYCAYCNQPLSHSLQVEHVIPKDPPAGYVPGDPLAWDNMLLACGPCNRAKWNTPIDAITYYLPEENNTHLPFEIVSVLGYGEKHAKVISSRDLDPPQEQKAIRTIRLLELDNIDERDDIVDIRSLKRRNAIKSVQSARSVFDMAKLSPTYDPIKAAEDIAYRASDSGFFSLWYKEFSNEPLVMARLVDNSIIKGTAQNCFDAANGYQPINRNPLNIADPI